MMEQYSKVLPTYLYLQCNSLQISSEMNTSGSKTLVSASDVTPTERWLNVWCIWHTKVEKLKEFQSRRQIGWIIQDFQETCVTRSLTFCLETKMLWRQTLSRKKKAVTTNAYQDQINTGFSKVCEIFKVCGIEYLKYVWEFYTVIVATFPCPETWRWTKLTV